MLLSNEIIYFDLKNRELSKVENKNTIKTDIKLTENLVIPDKINGIPVEHLDAKLFEYLGFKTVKLGNNLKEIPKDCFYESKLTELTIPKSVHYLKDSCFLKSPLIKLNFESGSQLKKIGTSCFEKSKLTELIIPKSVEYLDEFCFYSSPLIKLTFEPDSQLEEIGSHCFENSQLTELVIPKSVEYLESFCFRNSPIEKLTFEFYSQLKQIGHSCFQNSELTELTIPKSITYLGYSCFRNSPLINIIFEDKNIDLGADCFYRANLTKNPDINQKELNKVFNNSPFLFID